MRDGEIMKIFLLITAGSVLVYFFVVFPIWMIIKCGCSKTNLTWKIIWIGLMLVFFGLGSYFYAFFGSEDMGDRLIASVVFTIIIFAYLLIMPFQYKSMEFMKKNLLFQIGQVERDHLPRVDPAYAGYFRENLNTLKLEIKLCHFWELQKQIKSSVLVLSLTEMLSDKEFSMSEYIEWTNQFGARNDVKLKDFKKPFLKWKPVLLRFLGMKGAGQQNLNSVNVVKTLKPDPHYPFIGFWKEDCSLEYGLAINKASSRYYSITFCGPEQCVEQGKMDTTIYDDPNYQVVNANTLRIKGALGFETYRRCPQ